jgi:integrase
VNVGNDNQIAVAKTKVRVFEPLKHPLYRKGGAIYARVRVNGKLNWRSTATDNPAEARKWLEKWRREKWMQENGIEAKGVILHRQRVTVGELMDSYLRDGMRTRKGHPKSPATLKNEQAYLKPLRKYFGSKQAAAVSLADCDGYRDWRISGGYRADAATDDIRKKRQRLRAGTPSVDLELTTLSNVFSLAVRRVVVKLNPLVGRGRYSLAEDTRHCREVAPTPEGLKQIEHSLRARNEHGMADVVCFLAYSGLRIGEALPLDWDAVDWEQQILRVKREKRGIMPWVPILPEMEALLRRMREQTTSRLLFPSPYHPDTPRAGSAVRNRLTAACRALGLRHVTPHGLRSYFVTQARQSGLSDAEIAMLIGDKTGPAIIARVYGDVRPDHLFKQAQRIRLTVQSCEKSESQTSSIKSSITVPGVSPCSSMSGQGGPAASQCSDTPALASPPS